MGRGGNGTLDPQSLLYGRKIFRDRAPRPPAEAPVPYQDELKRLRGEQSPIFSTRLEGGKVAEAWFSHTEDAEPRSILRVLEIDEKNKELITAEMTLPKACREIKYLQRSGAGLLARWIAEDGRAFSTSVFKTGVSVSEPALVQGDVFHLDDGEICSARLLGGDLEIRRDQALLNAVSADRDSILIQGAGQDQGLIMVRDADALRVIDMASGMEQAHIDWDGSLAEAAFATNGDEVIACLLDGEGLFTIKSSERGELMSSPLVDGEALFRGPLSPLARDRDGNVCLGWTEKDSSGRSDIYGSRMTPDREGELHGHLIETCEPGVEVETVTVAPGSGKMIWTEYSGVDQKPAIRVSPLKNSPGRLYIGDRKPGEIVWIDSVRESAHGGGEVLWRVAGEGADSALHRNEI